MSRRHQGFTIVEMGIVLVVIAVLSTVVFLGAGYLQQARRQAAVELLLSLQKASAQYALRHMNGLAYGVGPENGTFETDARNVTLAHLQSQGFISGTVTTPFEDQGVAVFPHTSDTLAVCQHYACVEINMKVPVEECAGNSSLANMILGKAVSVSCNDTDKLKVVFR